MDSGSRVATACSDVSGHCDGNPTITSHWCSLCWWDQGDAFMVGQLAAAFSPPKYAYCIYDAKFNQLTMLGTMLFYLAVLLEFIKLCNAVAGAEHYIGACCTQHWHPMCLHPYHTSAWWGILPHNWVCVSLAMPCTFACICVGQCLCYLVQCWMQWYTNRACCWT